MSYNRLHKGIISRWLGTINYHPTWRHWYTLKIRDEPGYSPLLKCSRMLGHVRSHPKLYIVVVIC